MPAPYAQPAYGYGPRTNSLAIASLVTGILAWVACPLLGAILAIIFGHVARGQIKQSGEAGGGMAVAGLVLGYVNLAGTLLVGIVWVLFVAGAIIGGILGGGSLPSPSTSP
jgi:uncharacterized protein DUF4190